MTADILIVGILAALVGLAIGWIVASRSVAKLASDLAVANTRAADLDIVRQARDAVERERNDAMQELAWHRAQAAERIAAHEAVVEQLEAARGAMQDLASLRAQSEERQAAAEQTIRHLVEAREAMTAQFGAAAARALEGAQAQFLERAQARFTESEHTSGQRLAALLQPVHDRLQRYEEGVGKAEAERRDAFGNLTGLMESMRVGQETVRNEASKLVNALRNAPKARGRWGEQQLRNVLENCGLAEHTDFQTEVSVSDGEGGRLRPDAIVRVPGGKSLVIDAKVSLNDYQDAFGAVDDAERQLGLARHAASMRAHVNGLGNKSYWNQFDDAPDYVVMFVPGEHFLSAALEHDPTLWDFAFDKRVLLATPTNLIAIARTVSAVWRQEKLAKQAQEIGALGKELYIRLSKMGEHITKLGRNLETANTAYNAFVGSLESQVLTSAKRFEALNIDTAGKTIEPLPLVESSPRPLAKLISTVE
ncbi:DNA recombination protein RmuC [Sphingomonas sp. Leaf343]|uniref:DNA recombination protein RmuC n=1 Tax=Sphingomonas sp. Leaf343 TaxID=1736345 RepID=UPI0006F73BE8|nr:DNA recombination protein RmuC [Sphingomonas sp. Leaf343]KQR83897.1 recombinase RmuC [Sphingomonas sp. Leaf343]